jgi:small subunit ribosomal protein S3
MGHKVNPNGFRLGITTKWVSNWYAERGAYGDTLLKDMAVRKFLVKKLAQASVSRIQIDRPAKSARVTIHTARPGIVIGKKGEDIEKLKHEVSKILGLKPESVHLSVEEIRKPELDAKLIADSVAQQLERRIMFRRAMKRAVQNAMRLGAGGIKIQVSGRLNGAEIARTEWYREGRVPLHTLRAHVDYAHGEAKTTYGVIGVKVWVFTGEVFEAERRQDRAEAGEAAAA